MQALKQYLQQHYTKASAAAYLREITIFINSHPQANKATYQSIIHYLNQQRKVQSSASIHRILQSLKKYYNYLVDQEIREDNPTQFIYLKDYNHKALFKGKRLLDSEQLEQLWQYFLDKKYFQHQLLKNRNIALISLLLHQALRSGEITALTTTSIDLQKGVVHVPKTNITRARTLPLERRQLFAFYEYIKTDRAVLLDNQSSQALFITRDGRAEKGESLHTHIKRIRHFYKDLTINPNLIRMSVLRQKFNQGKSLQAVQYFAGHRYPSSTERYKNNELQALQASVLKHHPLG